jgi:AcrR family transcriptional regulator
MKEATRMAVRRSTARAAREPLSRDRVLRAAVELADAEGIDVLTMRRLAQALGVEAMSLYHHVSNKDDILVGMVELVVAEFDLPVAGTADWKEELRRSSTSAHEVLRRHPWAPNLILSGPGTGTARFRSMDAILGCLREAGFSAELTDHAYHALDSHVMGFTLWQVGISSGMSRLRGGVEGFLATDPFAGFPYLLEHAEQHLRPRRADDEGEFAFGLRLILDGLERLLSHEPAGRPDA